MEKPGQGNSLKKALIIGAGIAAAAAAGTYFLYGSKNAPKNRKKITAWSLKAKAEIMEQLEKLTEVTEDAYGKIVDEVSAKYQSLKTIDQQDLKNFVSESKSHWKLIAKKIGLGGKSSSTKKKAPKK